MNNKCREIELETMPGYHAWIDGHKGKSYPIEHSINWEDLFYSSAGNYLSIYERDDIENVDILGIEHGCFHIPRVLVKISKRSLNAILHNNPEMRLSTVTDMFYKYDVYVVTKFNPRGILHVTKVPNGELPDFMEEFITSFIRREMGLNSDVYPLKFTKGNNSEFALAGKIKNFNLLGLLDRIRSQPNFFTKKTWYSKEITGKDIRSMPRNLHGVIVDCDSPDTYYVSTASGNDWGGVDLLNGLFIRANHRCVEPTHELFIVVINSRCPEPEHRYVIGPLDISMVANPDRVVLESILHSFKQVMISQQQAYMQEAGSLAWRLNLGIE